MAFDLTKPSMTDATWAVFAGNIRENFRAIAQDDFTKTSGKLGIGIAPSQGLLHVISAGATNSYATAQIGRLALQETWPTGGYAEIMENAYSDGVAGYKFRLSDWAAAIAFEAGRIRLRTVGAAGVAGAAVSWLDSIVVDRGNGVGIGGSPLTNLTVRGAASATLRLRLGNDGTANNLAWNFAANMASGDLTIEEGSGGSARVLIGQAGNALFSSSVRIGSVSNAPAARLHVGVGGTGTTAEEIRIDSGSGSGGTALLSLYRNGVLKGMVAAAGAAGNPIAGAAADDLCIRNVQAIHFSADGGASLHASLTAAGHWSAATLTAKAAAVGTTAGQICYGATTATTVGAAGGASALPATPVGYIIINVAGTAMKIPYYNN